MKINDIILSFVFVSAMAAAFFPMIITWADFYGTEIDADYAESFQVINDSFSFGEEFSAKGSASIEGEGVVTDAAAAGLTLEGVFSYLKSFFSLPKAVRTITDDVTKKIQIPSWVTATFFVILSLTIIGAIASVAFRSNQVQ